MHTAADLDAVVADEFAIDATAPDDVEVATFAMGNFWHAEPKFGALDGVVRTYVGYAGGETGDPAYKRAAFSTKTEKKANVGDHAEAVQVVYDPRQLSYEDLLEVFWRGHDPTESRKHRYRSLILAHDDDQLATARAHYRGIERETDATLRTDVREYDTLYLANYGQQKYVLHQHEELLEEFRYVYTPLEFVASTAATRVNAVLAGHGHESLLEAIRDPFDVAAGIEV